MQCQSEFWVDYRHDEEGDDRSFQQSTEAMAKSVARRLSRRHGYAVASRRCVNNVADDDDDTPLSTLKFEWVFADGRLDFTNDLST